MEEADSEQQEGTSARQIIGSPMTAATLSPVCAAAVKYIPRGTAQWWSTCQQLLTRPVLLYSSQTVVQGTLHYNSTGAVDD